MEEADDIQEPTGDVFSDDNRSGLVVGLALSLNVPVLQHSNDVALISLAKL